MEPKVPLTEFFHLHVCHLSQGRHWAAARGTQDPAVMDPAAMNNRRGSPLPHRLACLPKSSSDQVHRVWVVSQLD